MDLRISGKKSREGAHDFRLKCLLLERVMWNLLTLEHRVGSDFQLLLGLSRGRVVQQAFPFSVVVVLLLDIGLRNL